MKLAAHKRDPVTGTSASFETEEDARLYFELAVTYWMSFTEIYRMVIGALHGPEALNDNFDLLKELRLIGEEGKQDAKLLANFDLPPEELFAVWLRSCRAMQRLANFFPNRREKIETAIAEQEGAMLSILQRHERRSAQR